MVAERGVELFHRPRITPLNKAEEMCSDAVGAVVMVFLDVFANIATAIGLWLEEYPPYVVCIALARPCWAVVLVSPFRTIGLHDVG